MLRDFERRSSGGPAVHTRPDGLLQDMALQHWAMQPTWHREAAKAIRHLTMAPNGPQHTESARRARMATLIAGGAIGQRGCVEPEKLDIEK